MKIELLKEHYFHELNRKQALEGALALPVAVITALSGLVFTLAQLFLYQLNWTTSLFVIFLSGGVGSLVLAFYYVFRASVGHIYELIPSANDLLSYCENLREYYEATGQPASRVEEEFELELKHSYATATTANKFTNDSKGGRIYSVNQCLICAAAFLAICAVPYFLNLKEKQPSVQKIEIVNIRDLKPDH